MRSALLAIMLRILLIPVAWLVGRWLAGTGLPDRLDAWDRARRCRR